MEKPPVCVILLGGKYKQTLNITIQEAKDARDKSKSLRRIEQDK